MDVVGYLRLPAVRHQNQLAAELRTRDQLTGIDLALQHIFLALKQRHEGELLRLHEPKALQLRLTGVAHRDRESHFGSADNVRLQMGRLDDQLRRLICELSLRKEEDFLSHL